SSSSTPAWWSTRATPPGAPAPAAPASSRRENPFEPRNTRNTRKEEKEEFFYLLSCVSCVSWLKLFFGDTDVELSGDRRGGLHRLAPRRGARGAGSSCSRAG